VITDLLRAPYIRRLFYHRLHLQGSNTKASVYLTLSQIAGGTSFPLTGCYLSSLTAELPSSKNDEGTGHNCKGEYNGAQQTLAYSNCVGLRVDY
jgi:hypothetical protein